MKGKWRVTVATVMLIAGAALILWNVIGPGDALLDYEEPIGTEDTTPADGEIDLPDDEVPLSDLPPEPTDPYEGLTETEIAYVNQVLDGVNEARTANGLPPLRLDGDLCKAARVRASECVTNFSHTRPDGSRYKTAITDVGINAGWTGENVATGYTSGTQVMQGWMKSDGHRANILHEKFTRIGIGLAENTGNKYRGYAWAQLFAND